MWFVFLIEFFDLDPFFLPPWVRRMMQAFGLSIRRRVLILPVLETKQTPKNPVFFGAVSPSFGAGLMTHYLPEGHDNWAIVEIDDVRKTILLVDEREYSRDEEIRITVLAVQGPKGRRIASWASHTPAPPA